MADFMMHNTLARQFMTDDPIMQDFCLIGAQGPDYVYYVLKKQLKSEAAHLGNTLHNVKTREFLTELLAYAIEKEDIEVLSYLIGFLTHYALDVAIHPYIYYYTGLYRVQEPSSRPYAGLHLQFERKVDVAFMKHQENMTAHKQNLIKRVLPQKTFPSSLKGALNHTIHKVYGVSDTGDWFSLGYQTMRRVYRIFVHDVTTLKQKTLKRFESYKKPKPLYFQDLSHAQKIDDFDFLNLQKIPWKHPVTGTLHHESVLDLYKQAHLQARIYIDAAKEAYTKKDASLLASVLNNASYDSGLPLDQKQTMTHFKSYKTA